MKTRSVVVCNFHRQAINYIWQFDDRQRVSSIIKRGYEHPDESFVVPLLQ